jgi:hypothetical protein
VSRQASSSRVAFTDLPMKTLTHETVARRAHELWQAHGCPAGRDTEFWLEAERQLATGAAEVQADSAPDQNSWRVGEIQGAAPFAEHNSGLRPSEGAGGHALSPPHPEQEAERAVEQRKRAREPILPGVNAPKHAPPESGKPIWRQPHSS